MKTQESFGVTRCNAINDSANASNLDEPNEETLTYEVSDEALEAAASVKERVGNFTVSYCTVFSNCPA